MIDAEIATFKKRHDERQAYLDNIRAAKAFQVRHLILVIALMLATTIAFALVGVATNFSPLPIYGTLAAFIVLIVYVQWRMEVSGQGRVLRDFEMRQKRHEARQRQQDVDAIADEILAEREHAR